MTSPALRVAHPVFVFILAVWSGMVTTSSLLAHGGAFRGPSGTPLSGGGGGPGGRGPGPTTGGFAASPTSWATWWEYNKDPYLRLRESVHAVSASAVPTGQGTIPASMAPDESTKRDRVLPVLAALAKEIPNRDVQTACMVAMAKVGMNRPKFDLIETLSERLERGNQEIRETAALCLGLSRRPEALSILQDLAMNTPAGRRSLRSESVDDRTRAFAIYGLGLVAERSQDLAVQQRVVDVLGHVLEVDQRDVQVAALKAYGVLDLSDHTPGHKRLRWSVLGTLWTFFEQDLGKGSELIQAHAATSIARLLGRGDSSEHERAKTRFAEVLTAKNARSPWIRQSAVIGLGALVLASEDRSADARYSDLLEDHSENGKDQLARFLSLIALAEIGGERNRMTLIKAYQDGGQATEKPWAGIALGILAFRAREASGSQEVDTTIGRVLHRGFEKVKNQDSRAATAVALGLVGYRDATRDMMKVYIKRRMQEVLRGYIAIGLALMDATEAVPMLRKSIDKNEHLPLTVMQSSIALGKLGDKEAIDWLIKSLKKGNASVARLSGIATSFRFIGDKRVVDELLALAEDRDLTKLSRAFVAAALGGVVDANRLPWNSSFSTASNYRARVGTLTNGSTGILDIL